MLDVERQLPFVVRQGFFSAAELACFAVGLAPVPVRDAVGAETPAASLLERLRQAVDEANQRFFGVELDTKTTEWSWTFGGAGTNWCWGLGAGERRRRKLGILIAVESTEARGGELQIFDQRIKTLPLEPGDLVIFPSYMQWRWSPLSSGRRAFLQGWFHGTPWH